MIKVAVKVLRLGGSNENRTQQERFNLDAVRRVSFSSINPKSHVVI